MTAHQDAAQWLAQNWAWVLLWAWVLGVFGSIGEGGRRLLARRREAVAARRRHELALARAQAYGQRMTQPYAAPVPRTPLPSPSDRTSPGPCPHPKLVPVVGADGTVKRFICGNPLCDAVFPPDTVIYEPHDDEDTP